MKKLAKLVLAFTALTALSTGLLALPYLTLVPDDAAPRTVVLR